MYKCNETIEPQRVSTNRRDNETACDDPQENRPTNKRPTSFALRQKNLNLSLLHRNKYKQYSSVPSIWKEGSLYSTPLQANIAVTGYDTTTEFYSCSSGQESFTTSNCRQQSEIIVLNVSGNEFRVRRSILRKYPTTLLGSSDLENFYNTAIRQYFFDRNRSIFEVIFCFYQIGSLSIHPSLDRRAVMMECKFFRISSVLTVPNESLQNNLLTADPFPFNSVGHLPVIARIKIAVYKLLNYPGSSYSAKIWTTLDVLLTLFSIICLFLQSEHDFEFIFSGQRNIYSEVYEKLMLIAQCFFTADFTLRLLSWPWSIKCTGENSFFSNGNNVLDIVALLLFYLPTILSLVDNKDVNTLFILRIIRCVRVIRLFSIVRHSTEAKIIFQFLLSKNLHDVLLLCKLATILVILSSSIMYYVEGEQNEKFSSVMISCCDNNRHRLW